MASRGPSERQTKHLRSFGARFLRGLGIFIVATFLLAVCVYVAFQVSPWPGVLVLRATGNDGLDTADGVARYVPNNVTSLYDEPYDPASPYGLLDVFFPDDARGPLPTIVWIHGGAFIAGTKAALPPYLTILASHGFTVVNVEYTKAPERQYPTPILQLNEALAYLTANAERFHIDPNQFVLAGDSAGAHITAQTALATVDATYRTATGLPAVLQAQQLKGVVLASGPYDLNGVDYDSKTFGWFLHTVIWAYTGRKDFLDDPAVALLSLVDQVSPNFPPTFITTGPSDPLLTHSEELAQNLRAQDVDVTTLFFPAATTDPAIGHEYQFDLNTPEARQALEAIVAFARVHTNSPTTWKGVSDTW